VIVDEPALVTSLNGSNTELNSLAWQALMGIQSHIASRYSNASPIAATSVARCRVLRLLMTVHSLRGISAPLMEEIFFAGLIGSATINSVLPHILRMDPAELIVSEGERGAPEQARKRQPGGKKGSGRGSKLRTLNETVNRLRQSQLQSHLRVAGQNGNGFSGESHSTDLNIRHANCLAL
jgi:hypothetical protein